MALSELHDTQRRSTPEYNRYAYTLRHHDDLYVLIARQQQAWEL